MTFRQAVDETRDLNGAWRPGLRALREIDRNRIGTTATRRLKGSVDVESRLQALYPGKRQWDYALGFDPADVRGEVVYWIEIHPANHGEVKVVLEKLQFLTNWLHAHGQGLDLFPRAFIWVSSGKTTFTLTSQQQKRFALLGLRHAGRFFKVPENFAE